MTATRTICLTLVAAFFAVAAACSGSSEPAVAEDVSPEPAEEELADLSGPWFDAACDLPPRYFERIHRDHFDGRSPDLIALPKEPNYYGSFVGTSHSGPWDYLQRIPLVFYGPGTIARQGDIAPGREVTLADVAPTIAEMLGAEWPDDRPGRSLSEVLLPEGERKEPKLIITVVWDGGGWNVLEEWPDSWPVLAELMREGTSVTNGLVGSSPSNTPVAHTNIGTGAFPDQHGIVDIRIRQGNKTVDTFVNNEGRYIEVPTIADTYDLAVDNEAEIGLFGYHPWHVGMMGHGARLEGADKDLAALVSHKGETIVGLDKRYFEFPPYADDVPGIEEDIRETDAADGTVDGLWMGHDVFSSTFSLKKTPAFIRYQTRIVREMIERERFGVDDISDLFFVNYKPMDTIGHKHNMVNPEMDSAVRASDEELAALRTILDDAVGVNEWVMIMTADHGQTPMARTTGAWPLDLDEILKDTAAHFGVRQRTLFIDGRVGYIWVNKKGLSRIGVTTEDIANFLARYTIGDNIPDGRATPDGYERRLDEKILAAAWPPEYSDEIAACIAG
ncbi:MAG TPA: alkaline phosphatase family protein [Actinomycetota bacterium]|nr:alkaline phosphatase family protein [Actinomycetota bacterium]